MPTQLSVEYIAGFFDGEGSPTITKPCKTMPTHRLYVNIGQTNRQILEEIKELYGGYISTDRRNNLLHRKVYYQLNLKCRMAERFLRDIYPYIRVKKTQVDIVFRFRDTQRIHRGRNHPLPEDIVTLRENLRLELMKLRTSSKGGRK